MATKTWTLVRPTGVVVHSATPFFYFRNLFLLSYFCYSLLVEVECGGDNFFQARAVRVFLPPPLLPAPPERTLGSCKIADAILQEMVSSFVVTILIKKYRRSGGMVYAEDLKSLP